MRSESDALTRPVFGLRNKLSRLFWQIIWIILCRFTPIPLHGWRSFVIRCFGGRIGKRNRIYPDVRIWAPWLLTTGDTVIIGPGVEVYNPGGIELGHHTIVSQGAYLCGATHDYNSPAFTYLAKPIRTEPYVWICARAIVLPGVECGEGCVLGAGSVATRSMTAWTVFAGNPARAIRARAMKISERPESE
jgi:putative colanic acid biosynthesis acetyltransferase WcaF